MKVSMKDEFQQIIGILKMIEKDFGISREYAIKLLMIYQLFAIHHHLDRLDK